MPKTFEITLSDDQVNQLEVIRQGTDPGMPLEQHLTLAAKAFIAAFNPSDDTEAPRLRFRKNVRADWPG